MKDIVFASNNAHKVYEAGVILGPEFNIITPRQLGYVGDIPETHDTIAANSRQKAETIWDLFGKMCFADDTGLEVDCLHGAPGVYSARYAGSDKDPAANRRKLLKELESVPFEERTARFRCVITLFEDGKCLQYEGICEGHIAMRESEGVQGFGFDSIFIPKGMNVTFAEIPIDVKNTLSHRGKAMEMLKAHLHSEYLF